MDSIRTPQQLLRIGYMNAQSIMAHLHDLIKLVGDNELHVLGVSKTFLKPGISSKQAGIPGYTLSYGPQ